MRRRRRDAELAELRDDLAVLRHRVATLVAERHELEARLQRLESRPAEDAIPVDPVPVLLPPPAGQPATRQLPAPPTVTGSRRPRFALT